MIWHKGWKAPTKAERERINQMMAFLCPCCSIAGYLFRDHTECHHIISGTKRMGHWYTLPICRGHHRGAFSERQRLMIEPAYLVAISDGLKLFTEVFPTERELWVRVQETLGLSTDWPQSKILPRRVA